MITESQIRNLMRENAYLREQLAPSELYDYAIAGMELRLTELKQETARTRSRLMMHYAIKEQLIPNEVAADAVRTGTWHPQDRATSIMDRLSRLPANASTATRQRLLEGYLFRRDLPKDGKW